MGSTIQQLVIATELSPTSDLDGGYVAVDSSFVLNKNDQQDNQPENVDVGGPFGGYLLASFFIYCFLWYGIVMNHAPNN